MSDHLDAESLPHGAAPAIAGDEVLRVHGALDAGFDVSRRGEHAVGDLLAARQLGEVAKLGPELERARAEDRLERLLREEQPAARADELHARVEARDVLGDLGAGERLDRRDAPVGVVLLL